MVASGGQPKVAAQVAVSNAYTLGDGEDLESVATRFILDRRTLTCANPGWQPGVRQIVLPLSATRRHRVEDGQTLGQIAALYRVERAVITDYPLNFWQGCRGVAGLGEITVAQSLPTGLILYIPDQFETTSQSSQPSPAHLPSGSQALTDDYQAENAPDAALTNPHPLAFQLQLTTDPRSPTPDPRYPTSPTISLTVSAPAPTPTIVPTPIPTPVPTPLPTPTPSQRRLIIETPISLVIEKGPVPAAAGQPLVWPMKGIITTYFSAIHPAVDIATSANTPIFAAQSGVVLYAEMSPYGYGNFVKVDHGDGRQTHYAHFSSIVVHEGQTVRQGQLLGYEGTTGNSTGPHLHFELVIDGRYVDPLQYLPK